ncbi:hypothetical protein TTHERM_01097920 (macronuclear) [Tetrahymena thermophila SB210]|uniref:Uncharacterized protein n=1 Tax=Tetrahymena thermophila (strain SB210) TaxID=312017 RepID=Q22ZG5_TETTS|nr:hypothetical protein TTHERM_01097920 [Tetrahymena thermophila SB210]EAR90682.1 hypothetical protein TTHERM_01097920 [Tetrahymena thermophila SB210]|eukprot:XP_001010927.1 hypothetical protein TTHERM_01097920 [Tetrahymena thermophila SB210]
MNLLNQSYQQLAIENYSQLIKSIDFNELKSLKSPDDFHSKIYQLSQQWLQNFPQFSDWIISGNPKEIPQVNKWYFVSEQDYSQRKFLQAKLNLKMASDSNQLPSWTLFDIKSYTKNQFMVRIIKLKNRYAEQRYNIQQLKKHYLIYTVNLELAINSQTISENSQHIQYSSQTDYSAYEKSWESQKNFEDNQLGVQNQQNKSLQRNPQNQFINQSTIQEMNLQRAGFKDIVDEKQFFKNYQDYQQGNPNQQNSNLYRTPQNQPIKNQQGKSFIDIEDESIGIQLDDPIKQQFNQRQNLNQILINNEPIIQNTNKKQSISVNQTDMHDESEIPTFTNKNIQQQPNPNMSKDNVAQNTINHKQNQNNQQNNNQMHQTLNSNSNKAGVLIDNNQIDPSNVSSSEESQDQIKTEQENDNVEEYLKKEIIILDLLNGKDEKIVHQKNKLKIKNQLIDQKDNIIKQLNQSMAEKDKRILILEDQVMLLQIQQTSKNQPGQGFEEQVEILFQNNQKYFNVAKKQKEIIDEQDEKIKMLVEQNEILQQEKEIFEQENSKFKQEIINLEQSHTQNTQKLQQSIQQLKKKLKILESKNQQNIIKLKNKYQNQSKRYKLQKKTQWLIKHQVINLQKSFQIVQSDYEKSKKKEKTLSKADQEIQTEPYNQQQEPQQNQPNIQEVIIKDEPLIKINNTDSDQSEVESLQNQDIDEKMEEQEYSAQEEKNQNEELQQVDGEFQVNDEMHQINDIQQNNEKLPISSQKDILNLNTILDQQIPQQIDQVKQQQISQQINQTQTHMVIEEEPINQNLLTDQQILQEYSQFLIEGMSKEDFIQNIRQILFLEYIKKQTQVDEQIAQKLQRSKENL